MKPVILECRRCGANTIGIDLEFDEAVGWVEIGEPADDGIADALCPACVAKDKQVPKNGDPGPYGMFWVIPENGTYKFDDKPEE